MYNSYYSSGAYSGGYGSGYYSSRPKKFPTGKPGKILHVRILNRKMSPRQLFGTPMVVSVPREATYSELLEKVILILFILICFILLFGFPLFFISLSFLPRLSGSSKNTSTPVTPM